jgi:hypothetical protein
MSGIHLSTANLKTSVAAVLSYLDGDEAEAITLALEQPGTVFLMDDRHGTVEARKRGLELVGTLAVLDRAAARGWSICRRCLGGCARAHFHTCRPMGKISADRRKMRSARLRVSKERHTDCGRTEACPWVFPRPRPTKTVVITTQSVSGPSIISSTLASLVPSRSGRRSSDSANRRN